MTVAPYSIIREILFKIMSQVLGAQTSELLLKADELNNINNREAERNWS